MDTGEWSGGGRGGHRGRSGQFGGGGGRYNDNYYGGRGGGGRGFYDQSQGQGGFYDGGRSGGRGRGGGYQGGGGGYQGGGGGGGYQGRGGGYEGGGYQQGRGGRFHEGGGRTRFQGGRTWHNPNPGQKRQQQVNTNPPPNMALLKTIEAHTDAITCLAYDQATNALFTGSKDGKIKQWDCTSGLITHEENPGGPVDALLFIQGFLFVAYVKGTQPHLEGIINFYNTATGKTQMIPGHRGHISQLLAANNMLFSCGHDCSIRVWGLEGEVFVCKGAVPNGLLTMEGTPDNKGESMLAIASLFDGVRIFNVDQSMALLGALPKVGVCRAITSIPGAAIVVGDDQGQVHIFSWTG
ncbi:Zinc finger CCCH domain-containing protein 63 [Tetrabaena socialis]|uniref:Zinc finger CCCH domain-containing protein 63 n=1 Tax=Tetrabaena socialis TaxID=47790 RepID=A0A2J8A614_9CHLO|nr:Zinc finger CCCH domain-containing protein 63 [Tetrabaena socialis]|eukprot:PNH07969.1 Zinc finger CCCH domain-containing protein 63 [Tetrabaena socialis]